MDILLDLVLNLVRIVELAQPVQHTLPFQPPLTFVPLDDIIADILPDMLSDQERQEIIDALLEITDSDISIALAAEQINAIVDILRVHTRNDEQLITQITMLNSKLQDALTLKYIMNSDSINHADIYIENINLFNHIQTVYIPSNQDGVYSFIIGKISQQYQDIQISLANNDYIEQKTKITHARTSIYPKLILNTPSKCRSTGWEHNKNDWLQRGSPEYDLEVYTYVERYVGSIYTRKQDTAYHISGRNMSLVIPAQDGKTLLVTTMRNRDKNVLMHCIRLQITE